MKESRYRESDDPAVSLMSIEVISELLASKSPEEFGQSLTEQLRELTGARTVMILLHPLESMRHELLAVSPVRRTAMFSTAELDYFCPLHTPGFLPGYSKDLPADHPLRASLLKADVSSIVRYPLYAAGNLVGLLIVLDIPKIDRIAELDNIINPLAPMIALAMRNALAYRQIEMQAQELEQRVERRTQELSQKNAELRESQERLDQLAKQSRSISWEVDEHGLYTFMSHVSESVIGYRPEEIVGKKHFYDIHPEEGREEFKKAAFEVFAQKGAIHNLLNPIKSGDERLVWVSTNGFPLLNEDGTLRGYRGSDTDVTERVRMDEERRVIEQQFQHTQKLESLGVLAGGIAHDFNNLLAVIIGHCSLATLRPEAAVEHIPQIEKAADRAAELCRQMLTYAGKSQLLMTQVNVVLLAEEMVKMLNSTISKNVNIKRAFTADIPSIRGDAGQINQILMNLIINAAEAIGDAQGEVCISVSQADLQPDEMARDHIGNPIPPGHYICLEVTDNGCGMDKETRQRIFEPFYTTKFTGRGLGMSAVLGIINAHKGALQLSSHPGRGTTFKVYLPIHTEKSSGKESFQQLSAEQWQGSGTVLLVEDEEQIRKVAKILFRELGFNVIEAANGREALEQYRAHAAEIRLVVTDMDMPVMDGYLLLRELKMLKPELPVIISSGFGDAGVYSRIPPGDMAGLISKPYKFDQLRKILKNALENPGHI